MIALDAVLMTLIEITEAVDAQIVRMQNIRAIVETLLPSPMPFTEAATDAARLAMDDSLGVDQPSADWVLPLPDRDSLSQDKGTGLAPLPTRRRRQGRQPKPRVARTDHPLRGRSREAPASALSGAVPQGPVVVSAANALRSRLLLETPAAQPNASTPSQPGHSLDDLVRQLSQRSA